MTIFTRMFAEIARKEKEEKKSPEMILVPYHILKGYLSECNNPIPDLTLKAHYRSELQAYVDDDRLRRIQQNQT